MIYKCWDRYVRAHEKCSTATGDELLTAQDEEADAIRSLAAVSAPTVGAVLLKMQVISDMLAIGGAPWSDLRVAVMVDSVTHDLSSLMDVAFKALA